MKNKVTTILALMLSITAFSQTLLSPNGRLKMEFSLTGDNTPTYSLSLDGKPVILPSQMGLDIRHDQGVGDVSIFWREGMTHGSDLRTGFQIKDTETKSADQTWRPVWGEVAKIRDNHNELAVTLFQPSSEREMIIRFRLFDDGLGFRYEFPRQKNLNYFIIGQEQTFFNLAQDMKTFWIAGDYSANEFLYETSKLSEIESKYAAFDRSGNAATVAIEIPSVQTPVMMKSPEGVYVNIHEAALDNYSSMQLEVNGTTLRSMLIPDAMGNRGYIQTDAQSPWRTIVVADNAPAILESKLILNLNEPCAIEDPSWIKPQKFVGVWWQMFAPGQGSWAYGSDPNVKIDKTDFAALTPNGIHAANTANVKKYIDFAAKNGIDGVLVEGWNVGWEDWIGQYKENVFDFVTPYPDFDVVELREYAKSKGVRLIMHHETSGAVSNYERRLEDAYQFMVDNNYNTVKSGYVGPAIPRGEFHYGQWMVNHFLYCIRKGVEYKIMIDAHEPVRPTGMHRTYPNYLAAESARGTEFETFSERGNAPEHTTILPFTRLMGGPMDYTPGIFEGKMSHYDPNSKNRVHTTMMKQLALYVTMYSPLQMVADLPENYERYADAFQFIKDVAVDWDASKVLEAEPGDYITIARKAKGTDNWFIGGITDENGRVSDISLDFLDPAHSYTATIYADGKDAHWDNNPKSYVISTRKVDQKSKLKTTLAPGGGYAVSIVRN